MAPVIADTHWQAPARTQPPPGRRTGARRHENASGGGAADVSCGRRLRAGADVRRDGAGDVPGTVHMAARGISPAGALGGRGGTAKPGCPMCTVSCGRRSGRARSTVVAGLPRGLRKAFAAHSALSTNLALFFGDPIRPAPRPDPGCPTRAVFGVMRVAEPSSRPPDEETSPTAGTPGVCVRQAARTVHVLARNSRCSGPSARTCARDARGQPVRPRWAGAAVRPRGTSKGRLRTGGGWKASRGAAARGAGTDAPMSTKRDGRVVPMKSNLKRRREGFSSHPLFISREGQALW